MADKLESELIDYQQVDLQTGEIKTSTDLLAENKDLVENQFKEQLSLMSGTDSVANAIKENTAIAKIISEVLTDKIHYGLIPNTRVKVLYQAGADVLVRIYGILIEYAIVNQVIDLNNHLIDFDIKATALYRGQKIGEAIASCNSLEKKYKKQFLDKDGNIIPGSSPYEIKNTLLQMAEKRAMVRVVRKIFGISGSFTQDEDMLTLPAPKDQKLSIYQMLYIYEQKEMGSNKDKRKNWLKLNILQPLCKEFCQGRNMRTWTELDIKVLDDKINDQDYIKDLIKKAMESDNGDS